MHTNSSFRQTLILLILIVTTPWLTSCATVSAPDERDPWESFNRSIYAFNDGFDRAIARPVAEVYRDYLPNFIQTGIANFFSNLDDILVVINDLLQLKFEQALQDLSRFVWNSTAGLFGLIDVAKHMDLPKNNEDFGQTLAVWGVGDGPYLVLPFLGPSNVRDTAGLVVDWEIDPLLAIDDHETRWGLIALRAVDTRASLLEATRIMEKSGIEPYVFMRNAYFQLRENQIYDGNPPRERMQAPSGEDLKLEEELEKELQLDSPAGK
jgi:phospholipid-binding lipoprotein MlaA